MKIYVNARFLTQPVSGVQRYGIECSLQIKKLHTDVIFVAPRNILYPEIAEKLGVLVVGKNTGHRWEQIDLPRYLKDNNSPPLFCPANTAPLYYSNTYFTLHDLAFYYHPEWNSKLFSIWYNFLMPRLARKAKHIFTVSETVKREIVDIYKVSDAKVSVTYNGIAEHMRAQASAPIRKEKIILSVGTFNARKNHHNLIKAFLRSDIKNDYRLIIVGDKNKVFKEVHVDEAELKGGHVEIMERLSEEALREMYMRAEAVASLSMYEGFGIPLLEGLFYGCKIICSDIPVYRELYSGHATFCDPTKLEEISRKLNELPGTAFNKDGVAALFEKYSYRRAAEEIIRAIH